MAVTDVSTTPCRFSTLFEPFALTFLCFLYSAHASACPKSYPESHLPSPNMGLLHPSLVNWEVLCLERGLFLGSRQRDPQIFVQENSTERSLDGLVSRLQPRTMAFENLGRRRYEVVLPPVRPIGHLPTKLEGA